MNKNSAARPRAWRAVFQQNNQFQAFSGKNFVQIDYLTFPGIVLYYNQKEKGDTQQ
jgi:hypothetical protein